jgi:hypothetical protein
MLARIVAVACLCVVAANPAGAVVMDYHDATQTAPIMAQQADEPMFAFLPAEPAAADAALPNRAERMFTLPNLAVVLTGLAWMALVRRRSMPRS